jgi:hypothetical protein
VDGHELIAVGEWERAQDDRINGGEDSGVGADAQGERKDDCSGEAGGFAQKTEGGAGIRARGFEKHGDVDFAELLGDLLAAAEVDARLAASLIGGMPAAW